jgi:hypothetical protein
MPVAASIQAVVPPVRLGALRVTMSAMPGHGPRLQLIAPSASPEQAAAIVAALERFMRATAPPASEPVEAADGWRRASILEGVTREPEHDLRDPWINT